MTAPTIRITGDVSSLPTVTFGPRSLMWWGTVGFMVIEAWTTCILVGAFFYLRQNYDAWPPLRTPYPSLLIPTINLGLFAISLVPSRIVERAAKRLDERAVKWWLLVTCLTAIPTLVMRWFELWALNTRWDTNAYGSAVWTIVGFHMSLMVLDIADTVGLTAFFFFRKMPVKAFSDTVDNSTYWYFTVALWIPLYLIIYVGPRIF